MERKQTSRALCLKAEGMASRREQKSGCRLGTSTPYSIDLDPTFHSSRVLPASTQKGPDRREVHDMRIPFDQGYSGCPEMSVQMPMLGTVHPGPISASLARQSPRRDTASATRPVALSARSSGRRRGRVLHPPSTVHHPPQRSAGKGRREMRMGMNQLAQSTQSRACELGPRGGQGRWGGSASSGLGMTHVRGVRYRRKLELVRSCAAHARRSFGRDITVQ
nr:hypothetical protein CFP56_56517 [Quercus suber]